MKISDALADVSRLYLDTAPFIYYIEDDPSYADTVARLFEYLLQGNDLIVTSVVTFTETLTKPVKTGDAVLIQRYERLFLATHNVVLVPVDITIARHAARLRAQHNLRTPDAIQIASAIAQNCQAVLTNDKGLQLVTEVPILLLDELEP